MNFDVFILFFNATLIPVISLIYVYYILRNYYLPVIKKEDEKLKNQKNN